MTEEIIIDGVNVAGCPNYYKKDGSCMSGDCDCTLCIHNDCYYKQLKRLEQENKELKIKLSSTKCYLCGEGFLTPEGTELYEEKNKYRSALEEIRENLVKLKTNDEDDFTYEYSKIEDKINEVLGDN